MLYNTNFKTGSLILLHYGKGFGNVYARILDQDKHYYSVKILYDEDEAKDKPKGDVFKRGFEMSILKREKATELNPGDIRNLTLVKTYIEIAAVMI